MDFDALYRLAGLETLEPEAKPANPAPTEAAATESGPELARDPEPRFHGFSVSELLALAHPEERADLKDNPDALAAFGFALRTEETRRRGERPNHYTRLAVCAGCGPVWLPEGSLSRVPGCIWCHNRGAGLPIPRPLGFFPIWTPPVIENSSPITCPKKS